VLAALFVFASLATLWGQATTSLRGTITDAQGAVIESATVSLINTQVGFRRSVLADATGTYQFLQVPPGKYSVSIEKPGFTSVTQQNVELLVNTPATMDVLMQVAAVASTVNVEAGSRLSTRWTPPSAMPSIRLRCASFRCRRGTSSNC
jgi:hypothetical protein